MSASGPASADAIRAAALSILEAIGLNDLNTLRHLLENYPKIVDNHKESLLHMAASSPNIKCLELILDYTANPIINALTDKGPAALHLAHPSTCEEIVTK